MTIIEVTIRGRVVELQDPRNTGIRQYLNSIHHLIKSSKIVEIKSSAADCLIALRLAARASR